MDEHARLRGLLGWRNETHHTPGRMGVNVASSRPPRRFNAGLTGLSSPTRDGGNFDGLSRDRV